MTTIGKDGRVEFWFFLPDVRDVRIVGDFAASAGPGGAIARGRRERQFDGLAIAAGPGRSGRGAVGRRKNGHMTARPIRAA
jgi:hypothetical protein